MPIAVLGPWRKRSEVMFGDVTRIGPNGLNQPGQPRCHTSSNSNVATPSGQGPADRGTRNGRRHQDAPPAFGTSLPPKWKACDPLAVVKTQLEFLARAQTEQNVHIEAQNTRVGRASGHPGHCCNRLSRGVAADRLTRGIPLPHPRPWWGSRRLRSDRVLLVRSGALLSGSSFIRA